MNQIKTFNYREDLQEQLLKKMSQIIKYREGQRKKSTKRENDK